jgi:hypothetical protein
MLATVGQSALGVGVAWIGEIGQGASTSRSTVDLAALLR